MPACCECRLSLEKAAFAKSQLKKPTDSRRCKKCARRQLAKDNGSPVSTGGLPKSPDMAAAAPHMAPQFATFAQFSAQPDGSTSVRTSGASEPPIEPGRSALVRNLKARSDLNGTVVTIKKILDSGRVAVEVPRLPGTSFSEPETVAIKPENLQVQWNPNGGTLRMCGHEVETCPICMDTEMETGTSANQTASIFSCCGGKICHECFIKTQKGSDPDRCPLCREDTSDTSDATMVRQVRKRAERGDASAQYNLACYYDFGQFGVRKDQREARRLYELAAVQGHPRAADNLAVSHRDGEGGPVNMKEAARWFRVAADLGHVQAMTNLGLTYMGGRGVARDFDEAKRWLKKGADAGDELAVQQLHMLQLIAGAGPNVMFA